MARALLKNPNILILDDSTSKLDIETEQKILYNIRKNYPEITIIIVAQKIASVKDLDRIYVIEEGKNESKGTHEELLNKSKTYSEIFHSQQRIEKFN